MSDYTRSTMIWYATTIPKSHVGAHGPRSNRTIVINIIAIHHFFFLEIGSAANNQFDWVCVMCAWPEHLYAFVYDIHYHLNMRVLIIKIRTLVNRLTLPWLNYIIYQSVYFVYNIWANRILLKTLTLSNRDRFRHIVWWKIGQVVIAFPIGVCFDYRALID